jgi:hypothetical protein
MRDLLHEDGDVICHRLKLSSSCKKHVLELKTIFGTKAVEETRTGRAADIPSNDLELLVDGPHWLRS